MEWFDTEIEFFRVEVRWWQASPVRQAVPRDHDRSLRHLPSGDAVFGRGNPGVPTAEREPADGRPDPKGIS